MKVGIREEGIVAERRAREWLMQKGIVNLQQLDWLYKTEDGRYFCIECKARELFESPPFCGTGLDLSQLKLRTQLFNDLGIDTILLVYEKGTDNIYWQKLSVLEQGKFFDTKNGIRIYEISQFNLETNNSEVLMETKTQAESGKSKDTLYRTIASGAFIIGDFRHHDDSPWSKTAQFQAATKEALNKSGTKPALVFLANYHMAPNSEADKLNCNIRAFAIALNGQLCSWVENPQCNVHHLIQWFEARHILGQTAIDNPAAWSSDPWLQDYIDTSARLVAEKKRLY